MDIQEILKQVDSLFAENKGQEAERLMLKSAAKAVDEQDDGCLLQLLNELLGYYRQTSQHENSFRIAGQAVALAEHMDLKGTLPYATTLLNVATAYRAGGRLQESLEYYLVVEELYFGLLPEDDMYIASLENNLSLLYQELGDYGKAKKCQLKALKIAENHHSDYEVAVTYTNLAATCAQLEEREEFHQYALRSAEIFKRLGAVDSHYAASLATLGLYHLQRQEYDIALDFYHQAMEIVERGVGRNEAYHRLQEYVDACEAGILAQKETAQQGAVQQEAVQVSAAQEELSETAVPVDSKSLSAPEGKGLALCRAYYETYGRPMIAERFPGYESRIAVGLVGKGSDCFGFDDVASRDHDWGPGFCMWLTDETYESIGEDLQEAYNGLPLDFEGYHRAPDVNAKSRRGVMRISDFYRKLVGTDSYDNIDWRQVQDYNLAEAVNGSVFRDDEGIFSTFREKLLQGYPEEIRFLKLAESAASFSQAIQYNFPRMWNRGDGLTAHMLAWDGLRAAMKLQHYIQGKYPPHDKWLYRSLQQNATDTDTTKFLEDVAAALERLGEVTVPADSHRADGLMTAEGQKVSEAAEGLGAHLAMEMYGLDIISDIDSYLDHHSQELIYKSSLSGRSQEELVEEIARLEFEAFDKVKNEGGRASCQNDWPTFSIMRKSQYLTWNRTMLTQYLFDFNREYHLGHNLIEEKYARMMESTAPEQYEELKGHFPELTGKKKAVIQQICSMQVGWMEEFAKEYPALADNARSIHTYEDNPFNTSYETYLRGELGTYSDKMLELYGRYIVDYARSGANPAMDIMKNNVRMYGYKSIEEAERRTAAAWQGKGGAPL